MTTKCIKLAIMPIDKNYTKKEIYKYINDMQYLMWKASNHAMMLYYQEDLRIMNEKAANNGVYIKDKELYGTSFTNHVWRQYKIITENKYTTSTTSSQNQFVKKRYGAERKDVFRGNRTLSTFNRDLPVILHNKSVKIYPIKDASHMGVKIAFASMEEKNNSNVRPFEFVFINPDKSSFTTLNKIATGEYKQGTSQIMFKKNKLMLIISYSFKNNKENILDENKIMGVDLGIVKTASMSIYNSSDKKYERLNWKESSISGDELIHYRQKILKRNKELSIATKWSSENKTGHGYVHKMKFVNKQGNKVANFRDTYNHKISRYIVNLAVKNNCGTIQMEDLSGFSADQNNTMLKNWSYYDLQSKVRYKAEEEGIKFILIDPQYTSKRCNKCGHIDNQNRNCEKDQASFECVKCGHKDNADNNAAKNIAIPDIDAIIREQLKELR